MANYAAYIPVVGSTTYPTQISNFITISEAFDTEIEVARNGEASLLDGINLKLSLTGGTLTGNLILSAGNLDVTGNIIVSGTVDGRDIATDGTRLDSINTNVDTLVLPASTTISTFGASIIDDITAAAAISTLGLNANVDTLVLPASTTISTFGASLVDDTTATAAISTLGLNANLSTLVLPASTTISTFGASLVDDTTATAARTTLSAQVAGTYNTIIGTDTDVNTSGTTIIDAINVTDGVITSMGTRTFQSASTVLSGISELATAAEMVTGTDTGRVPSVSTTKNHQGVCKAWVNFNGVSGATIRDSYNVTSITRHGIGDYTVNFATAMGNTNYSVSGMAQRNNAIVTYQATVTWGASTTTQPLTTTSFRFRTPEPSNLNEDCLLVTIQVFGDY